MSIKEKFETAKSAATKKWKEANAKYPWLKPVLIGVGIGLTGYAIYRIDRKLHPAVHELKQEMANSSNDYAGMVTNFNSDVAFNPANKNEAEDFKELWEREYKDNWDEVVECVKRLSLKPGEMFIIEDQKQFIGDPYYDKMNPDMPIISHLVNDVGVYPPEE